MGIFTGEADFSVIIPTFSTSFSVELELTLVSLLNVSYNSIRSFKFPMNAKMSPFRLLQQSLAIVNMCARALAVATCLCGAIQGAETETSRAPQTYFVAPSGSDDNAGTTQAKAWRTISKVNKSPLQPGDSVLLAGGKSFAGNLLITASGNKNAFITIGSYGAGPATIQAGDSFGIRLLNCQFIKVHDLILAGSGATVLKPNANI